MPPKTIDKGQQSILSFLGKASKATDGPQSSRPAKRPRTEAAENSRSAAPPASQQGERPSTLAAPLPPRTIPPRDVVRHEEFQRKLVLGGPAVGPGKGEVSRPPPLEPGPTTKLTPLEQQVARLKAQHPGCVLLVEVGYKMKLFGRDAEIAQRELGVFAYPDHAYLTASVPVPRLHVHVRRLVEAGHRVGVVRQMESAAIKKAGDKPSGPFERRLTALYTRATLEAGALAAEPEEQPAADEEGAPAAPPLWTNERLSSFLLCVVEKPAKQGPQGGVEVGLCAVEASTGNVLYTQFRDTLMRPELERRILFAAPAEVLVAQPVSTPTARLLAALTNRIGSRQEQVPAAKYVQGGALVAVTEFYGRQQQQAGSSAEQSPPSGDALDAVMRLPPLVVRALAHALDYLRPYGVASVLHLGAAFSEWGSAQELELSPNALRQLEVLRTEEGQERGSLLWLLDHTATKPGARLLREWVAKPLRSRAAIMERQEAVEELLQEGADHAILSRLPSVLAKLPDLERICGRAYHRTAPPDEVVKLLRILSSLHAKLGLQADIGAAPSAAESVIEGDASSTAAPPLALQGVRSPLLQQLLRAAGNLALARAATDLLGFIDEQAAAVNDKMSLFRDPERFPQVSHWQGEASAAERGLQALLPQLARRLNVSRLQYLTVQGQGEYLVEVPTELAARVPRDWVKVSSVKKAGRYHPPEVSAALARRDIAREHLEAACRAAWQDYLADFASHYTRFRGAVAALAALDCLQGLAHLAGGVGYCRPELVGEEDPPQLHIEGGRHPVLDVMLEGGSFVPNDTHLQASSQWEGDAERMMVITGPNMGGKSCYMRGAALLVIMAQVGSFVPAQRARLHCFDQLFTRMGASDNLALGMSTFAEELGEASVVLQKATPRSLVIIDELGRGTSTRDGEAIAEATVEYLVTKLRPLTLFVTHYPTICTLQQRYPANLGCYRMSYLLEEGSATGQPAPASAAGIHAGDSEHILPPSGQHASSSPPSANRSGPDGGGAGDSSTVSIPKVIFLYKLERGVAHSAFGLNVARMAGLPKSVLEAAASKAAQYAHAAQEEQRHLRLRQAVQLASSLAQGLLARDRIEPENMLSAKQRVMALLEPGDLEEEAAVAPLAGTAIGTSQ